MNWITTFLPFLRWFPLTSEKLRYDLVAGITVALILVPQSMAYAQLAGLPVEYGLYASFIPVIIASMWGSSSQLHTGPVAMLSLMSAAALIPFATPGSEKFIELSIMLAFMVGVLRLFLGVFKLGAIVNLLSSPVIVGFTNAAALIIGLSQFSKIIGVPFPRTDNYLADLWRVVTQIPEMHILTLLFGIGAWIIIDGLKKYRPAWPGVLIVVVLSIVTSYLIGFEKNQTVSFNQFHNAQSAELLKTYSDAKNRIDHLISTIADSRRDAKQQSSEGKISNSANLFAQAAIFEHELNALKADNTARVIEIHNIIFISATSPDGNIKLFNDKNIPEGYTLNDGEWRFTKVTDEKVMLSSGGSVVGIVPEGLPSLQTPHIEMSLIWALFPAALVMALIGFMEATSISKAIASTTGERVDASKELVGQGLANIAGSFFGSFTVSGSFSRSAVAAKTGAKTGVFAIISAATVVIVLLFFTPYLYHLPQAVLAVIVMMAVFGLIRIRPLVQAWKVDRFGAIIGIITFFATLIMAPAIANGILFGLILTVVHFLIISMKPRSEIVSRKDDGSLGGMKAHKLEPISELFVPVRFDGALTFTNVAYFEDIILKAQRKFPSAKAILIIGSGINEMDASGDEKVRELNQRLKTLGVQLAFSGLKYQVCKLFIKSGLIEEVGKENFYPFKEKAITDLLEKYS